MFSWPRSARIGSASAALVLVASPTAPYLRRWTLYRQIVTPADPDAA